ncbi:hypothetical protein GCM10020219_066550 [Nonomuraea dietziae]
MGAATRRDAGTAGESWSDVGDVVAAIERVDWMWRSGEWFGWWRGASALVDDSGYLPHRLEELALGECYSTS